MIRRLLLLIALCLCGVQAGAVALDADRIARGATVRIDEGWRFMPGDDPQWSDPALDDSSWPVVDSRRPGDAPIGWFRLRVDVPEELRNVPLALGIDHAGASEVYIDGRKIATNGTVAASRDGEVPVRPIRPVAIVLPAASHLIAVRFSSHVQSASPERGFSLSFRDANRTMFDRERWLRSSTIDQSLLAITSATFAVFHLFLFLFHRRAVENLLYAIFTASMAVLFATDNQGAFVSSIAEIRRFEGISTTSAVIMLLAALLFAYRVFFQRIALPFIPLALGGAVIVLVGVTFRPPWFRMSVLGIWAIATLLELLRVVVVAFFRKRPGSRIIGAGFAMVAVAGVTQMLMNLGVLPRSGFSLGLAFLLLLVLVSVHLSRNFALTSRELEKQLVQVRELSERTLEQEREARRRELAQRLLEADNARKTAELERARQVQLSMLPSDRPDVPNFEIAFAMRTATEVGGDYYDYVVREDGSTLVAIGDATGHGLDSGIVVAATKSLLRVSTGERNPEAMRRIASGIRSLGLRRMNMALSLVNVGGDTITLASGGMPPAIVVRAEGGEIEEISPNAPPLGAVRAHVYEEVSISLGAGDLLVLMSDGLPETLDAGGEWLGYEAVQRELRECAASPLEAIIERLLALSDRWRGDRPQDDDVTLTLIRRKG
ncbi:MAG TPA: SpoIIE family protein phosphatase [Thermoanaerobaculia bacterium]